MKRKFFYILAAVMLFAACDNRVEVAADMDAPIYPDYANVTIPVNIAPLNFVIRNDKARDVRVFVDEELMVESRGDEVVFDDDAWKEMLSKKVGKTIEVNVHVGQEKEWVEYRPFTWTVVPDSLDPYLTYRLIEPDYEVYSNLQLQERCVENFETRNFCDYERVGNRCMNCHTYSQQDSRLSMFYVRGKGGGAVLNRDGNLSLLDIKTDSMPSGSVYFSFHPDGRHIVFSANKIIPAFHSSGSKRLEVFDTKSDVYVADIVDGRVKSCKELSDSMWLETFPTFSPDGKEIYFCTARSPFVAGEENLDPETAVKSLQYKLCKISFDVSGETFGSAVDTLLEAGTSVCHPRVSPDGKRLLYSVQDYGTFPIWHREADLRMIDLKTLKVDSLSTVNSPRSDTYHSWSSNSRWFVFASKRDDGLYGKPYFCYVDREGKAHKPFVLPQSNPRFYDNSLKSFNAPELGRGKLPFTAADVRRLLRDAQPRKFSGKEKN